MKNELSLFDGLFPLRSVFFDRGWDDLMGLSTKDSSLPLDYEEKEEKFLFSIDMPGISKDDVSIEVDKNCLVVNAERKEEMENKSYTEKKYGRFQRMIRISQNVQSDKINAKFKDGVLTLEIPKSESVKAKIIPIK